MIAEVRSAAADARIERAFEVAFLAAAALCLLAAWRRAGCRRCASMPSRRSRRRLSSERDGMFTRHHNRGRMNKKAIVGLVAVASCRRGRLRVAASEREQATASAGRGRRLAASAAAAAAGPPVSVTTVAVQKRDVDVMLEATGTVTRAQQRRHPAAGRAAR